MTCAATDLHNITLKRDEKAGRDRVWCLDCKRFVSEVPCP